MPLDFTPATDQNSPVPASVARAARAAEALHAQLYAPQPAAPQPPLQAAVADGAPQPPAVPETGGNGSWEHRYLSKKGRNDQLVQDQGQMQQLLQDMGNELAQTRQLLRPAPQGQHAPARRAPPQKQITAEDEARYGPELLGLIQRAARDVVVPTIDRYAKQTLAQTEQLIQPIAARVEQTAATSLYQILDRDVADWRAINNDPRFKAWVRLQDVYSGVVRETLLQDAFQAADAPRVVSFFKGFLAEEQATGNRPVLPQAQPAPQVVLPQPAIDPLLLASPGRYKPAGGEPPLAADKPVFTRKQISTFYDNVRRGAYDGRDQDRMNAEAQIFAAQSDGRIR